MKCHQGGQPGASPGRDGGVRLPATGVEGKDDSVRTEGGGRAAWTRRGPLSPGTVGVTRPIFPSGDPGSPVAFLGGGKGRGWSTDSGPGSLGVSSCPAVDRLCVPGQATLLPEPQLPQSVKQRLRMQSQSIPQVIAKSTLAIAKLETLCVCSYPLSPERPCPSLCAGAVDWAAVPFKHTSSGFGANGTHGGDSWESQRCGGEYDFMEIILEAIRGAMDRNRSQLPGLPRGRQNRR